MALTIAWIRLAMVRSGSGNVAIFATTVFSPHSLSLCARASAFSSWARAFIAAFSTSVNPLDFLPLAVVLLADFCVLFFAGFLLAMVPPLEDRETHWGG